MFTLHQLFICKSQSDAKNEEVAHILLTKYLYASEGMNVLWTELGQSVKNSSHSHEEKVQTV